jgi:cytochrome c oxidase assembly protein subunit 16
MPPPSFLLQLLEVLTTSQFARSKATTIPIVLDRQSEERSLFQISIPRDGEFLAPTSASAKMPAFQRNTFRSSSDMGKAGMRYRALMAKYPFFTFGLPFILVIVGGSFVLTPATAVRYERQDRKVRQMTKEEELGVRRSARKVDMREEYNVSSFTCPVKSSWEDLPDTDDRDSGWLEPRIWRIGSRNASRGFRARTTAFFEPEFPYEWEGIVIDVHTSLAKTGPSWKEKSG